MAVIRRVLSADLPYAQTGFGLVVQYCRLLWMHVHECEGELKCPVLYCGDVLKTWLDLLVPSLSCIQISLLPIP